MSKRGVVISLYDRVRKVVVEKDDVKKEKYILNMFSLRINIQKLPSTFLLQIHLDTKRKVGTRRGSYCRNSLCSRDEWQHQERLQEVQHQSCFLIRKDSEGTT